MTKPKRTKGVRPITIDSLQRASVQNILHNILQYSAQYSARNIQRTSAHNILHPVLSFPRLQSAHFLVAAINNDSCICFTTLSPGSNRRGCGRVRKKKPRRRFLLLMWVIITLLLLFCCCHRKKQLPHLPCGELTAAAA